MDGSDARRAIFRGGVCAFVGAVGMLCLTEVVAAANAAVGLSSGTPESVSVPQWLYLLTGGAVIGASGLLASVVTDRTFIRALHAWHRAVPTRAALRTWAVRGGRLLGVVVLVLSIYIGFTGPKLSNVNFAYIVTFVGARAGLTMVAYLLGNPWPLVNPWRTIVETIPVGRRRPYPERFGVWPAVVGLLALVFIETLLVGSGGTIPVPRVLAVAILGYTLYTVAGGIVFGADDWFRFCDPLAVVFRFYGYVAPLQRTENGIELRLPGAVLTETNEFDIADSGFAIALIWELTFSGFVTTTLGTSILNVLSAFVPQRFVLFALFIVGYAVFLGAFWLAARVTRNHIETYLSVDTIATWMAPSLLAIAAGYHLAHYFWLFIQNIPTFIQVVGTPLSPPANPLVFAVPMWWNGLNIAFILLGHLLAVWVAHARAYDLFPSRLQAIRSQFPFIGVMIGYTVISLWLISLS
jgi:hypothetical protein